MIDKINRFDNEIRGDTSEDLNKKVDDIFVPTGKHRHSRGFRTEIPIGELSLHKDLAGSSDTDIDPDYSPFDPQEPECAGPFKITKVTLCFTKSNKPTKLAPTNLPKNLHFGGFNNLSDYQKFKDQRNEAKDSMERFSDITNDKSSASFPNESVEDGASPYQQENPELYR